MMGGGIWAMHIVGRLAFSLRCGTDYGPLGALASVMPRHLGERVALSVINNRREPGLLQSLVRAVPMGVGILFGTALERKAIAL